MKIAHECMNEIFPAIQMMTDYDYCLVHLMDENAQYRKNFEQAARMNREIILDNSIFELGEAYDEERYIYWVANLKPTYTIIPDVLNSYEGTVDRLNEWFEKYPNTAQFTKPIAVVQGSNEDEALACFDQLQNDERVSKIGISFDSASHLTAPGKISSDEKMHFHMRGRIEFLNKVTQNGQKVLNKPLHLLGCSLPQEMKYYKHYLPGVIDSVDTSSPIIHGYFGIRYNEFGLASKHPTKLFTLIDEPVTVDQLTLMASNIHAFRSFTR